MDSHVKTETGNVETVKYVNNTPASLKETYGPEERRNFYMKSRVKVSVGRHRWIFYTGFRVNGIFTHLHAYLHGFSCKNSIKLEY